MGKLGQIQGKEGEKLGQYQGYLLVFTKDLATVLNVLDHRYNEHWNELQEIL